MTYDPDDELLTQDRKALETLYEQRGIVPKHEAETFTCPNFLSCSQAAKLRLLTGTWAYVGSAYGQAQVEGRHVKILFVAMDIGGKDWPDLSFAEAQHGFRSYAEKPENPHMGSVHLLLRELVDNKDPVEFSRQYALTNAVKCRPATGYMETRAPAKLMTNCACHLQAEIEILRPTLVITQGEHPAWTVKNLTLFEAKKQLQEFLGVPRGRAEVFRVQDQIILLTTPHSRIRGLKWKQGILPQFLIEAVERVRRELATIG